MGGVEEQAVQPLDKSVCLGKHKTLNTRCVLLSLLTFVPLKHFVRGDWKNSEISHMQLIPGELFRVLRSKRLFPRSVCIILLKDFC